MTTPMSFIRERLRGFMHERADVGAMLDGGNECGHGMAGVLEQVAPMRFERPLVHPHDAAVAFFATRGGSRRRPRSGRRG